MQLGLQGKVVGVTGGANGIGKAIAEEFARQGCTLLLCDVNDHMLQQTRQEFTEKGYTVLAAKVDVTSSEQIGSFVQQATEQFGSIDIWINNAGIYPQKQIIDMSEQEWDRVFAINVKSVFLCSQAVAMQMKQQKAGVIINAASFAAVVPSAGSGAYAATKAAVLSMTKTLAAELAPHNIRCNAYIPGVIETPMTREVIEQKQDQLLSHIALHRLGLPRDVAHAIIFLASDAASYITGTTIEVSGGKLCVQNPDFGWKKEEEK